MNKLLVLDPISIGLSHASFNSVMIEAILMKYKKSMFLLEENQAKILDLKKKERIEIHSWKAPNKRLKFMFLVDNVFLYYSFYRKIKKWNANSIFFLAADNFFTPILIIILSLSNSDKHIYTILHNNIQNMDGSFFKNFLWKLASLKDFTGIVLADFVKNKIRNRHLAKNIHVIKHPTFQNINKKFNRLGMDKIDFLILGRHSNSFEDVSFTEDFLSTCSKYSGNKDVIIFIKKNKVQMIKYKNIKVYEYSSPLPNEKYWSMLSSARFLFIPPVSAERLTASGVLADAITAGVIVIAPKEGPFIEFLPNSCHSFLYEKEEFSSVLKSVMKLNDDEYNIIRNDILHESELYSIEKTSIELMKLFQLNNNSIIK